MKPEGNIEYIREKSLEAEAQGSYESAINLSHKLISLLGDDRLHLRMSAFQWDLVARMHLRLREPTKAEMAARNSINDYLRYKASTDNNWTPERDCYLADFRMTLALSLAYQKRYTEALDSAEQWEKAHFKVRNENDPFIRDVVVPHMRRLRARQAGEPVPEDGL